MTDQSGDFTPLGLKLEGPYENHRNASSRDLIKAIIREVYGAGDVIVAHHLTYVVDEQRPDGAYENVEEIPSFDTLIFDHTVAHKIWGEDWTNVLTELALLPVPERDVRLAALYSARSQAAKAPVQGGSAKSMTEILHILLEQAEIAHQAHERDDLDGKHDDNWAQWYADFMARALIQNGYYLNQH